MTPLPVAERLVVKLSLAVLRLTSVATGFEPRSPACELNALPLRHRGGHNTLFENMSKKIAQSGLPFFHFAFTRNPQEGIRNLFTEFAKGHVRITNRKKLLFLLFTVFSKRDKSWCQTNLDVDTVYIHAVPK